MIGIKINFINWFSILFFTQIIYLYAREMGCEDLVESKNNLQDYFPTRILNGISPIREFIDDYDNEFFLAELLERLVERDLIEPVSKEKYKKMNFE